MLVTAAEQMFAAAEPCEMNILAVFPKSFFESRNFGDLRAARAQISFDLVPSQTEIPVPGKTPNDPARVLDAENVVGQAELPRRVIDGTLGNNFKSLRQSRVKIERLGFVIGDHDIAWLGNLAEHSDTSSHGSWTHPPQIADEPHESHIHHAIDRAGRNMRRHGVFAD